MHRPLYDELAENYEIIEGRDWKREIDLISSILRGHGCNSIIDLGCGSGYHVNELAKEGFSAIGLDISPKLISQAKERAKFERTTAQYVLGSYYEFKSEKKYDAALCLNWSIPVKDSEIRTFLNNSNRLLKNNGILIFDYERKSDIVYKDLNRTLFQKWENNGVKIGRVSIGALSSSYVLEGRDVYIIFGESDGELSAPVESARYLRANRTGAVNTYVDYSYVRFFSLNEIRKFAKQSAFKVASSDRLRRGKYTREYTSLEKLSPI